MTKAPDINYAVADRDLRYFVFDWDDNVLHMPTHIHLERLTDEGEWVPYSVSTSLYSLIRNDTEHYRPPTDGAWEAAFRDFRDIEIEEENVFLRDTREAIDRIVSGESARAPSFGTLKKVLTEGRLFAIVTARGHDPEVLKAGVRYFIDRTFSPPEKRTMLRNLRGYLEWLRPGHDRHSDDEVLEYYLGLNKYHGCMSPRFRELLREHNYEAAGTEEGKQFAIRDFVRHVIGILREHGVDRPISVGFSDDDEGNARAVETYIEQELAREFPGVKFAVYYTNDPDLPSGRKVEVRGQLSLGL
ncbi:MAG: hypothetical protein QGH42_12890 [Kiritimatiellia bacterium]|jgi:hypothetical protein|nr:hypothetical protein [Kiritimatiellia bacterium]MDP6629807.1 hypothetical protein [Kiritimatiellia bacterium]MDP6809769.1 hypothetical protein [Kiritimatiellia bacterium]MDP7025121.1 hypothetical protein [Kiritimatiellia bacterium]